MPPTIIIVMDTSLRMLEDGNGNFYDPTFYKVSRRSAVMGAFPNIDTATTKTYRRMYTQPAVRGVAGKYTADSIARDRGGLGSGESADLEQRERRRVSGPDALQHREAAAWRRPSGENAGSTYRWGADPPAAEDAGVARVAELRQARGRSCAAAQAVYSDTHPCNASGGAGNYAIYAPSVTAASYAQATAPAGTVMVTPAANTASAS